VITLPLQGQKNLTQKAHALKTEGFPKNSFKVPLIVHVVMCDFQGDKKTLTRRVS